LGVLESALPATLEASSSIYHALKERFNTRNTGQTNKGTTHSLWQSRSM
jgi:hypothetical protein